MVESLLDSKIDCYLISWKRTLGIRKGPGTIHKRDGNILGYIKAGGMINRYISLIDTNRKTIVESRKSRIHSFQYSIKDNDGEKIGTVYGKTHFHLTNDMKMKNESDKKILEIKINDKSQYEIHSDDGKLIATDIPVSIKNLTNDASEFQILESDYDRKRLWGLYISFLSGFNDHAFRII